jgi:recombinational DNA repair protein (RecF pathway)
MHHAFTILPKISSSQQKMLVAAVSAMALRLAGLMPDLAACHVCGEKQPQYSIVLDSHESGWHCLSCHKSLSGTGSSLSPRLFKALKWVIRYPERVLSLKVGEEESSQLLESVRQYSIAAAQRMMYTDEFKAEASVYG